MTLVVVSPPAGGLLNHAIALCYEIGKSGKSTLLVSGPEAKTHLLNIGYKGAYKLLETHSHLFTTGRQRISHFRASCKPEYVEKAFHDLNLIVKHNNVTAIISKNQPHSKIVAYKNDIPWIAYHTGGLFHLHKEVAPLLSTISQECLTDLQKVSKSLVISNLFETKQDIFISRKMNLVRGVPALFPSISVNQRFDVPFIFTGALTFDGNFETLPKISKNEPIFITFGTVCNDLSLYQLVFQYFEKMKWPAIMSWPNANSDYMNSNYIDIHPYIPNHAVISDSSLVIHHGGVGTLLTCLHFGVPQLILPYNFNRSCQLLHGKNLELLGIGKVWERNTEFEDFMNKSIAWSKLSETRKTEKRFSELFRVQDAQYRTTLSTFFKWI